MESAIIKKSNIFARTQMPSGFPHVRTPQSLVMHPNRIRPHGHYRQTTEGPGHSCPFGPKKNPARQSRAKFKRKRNSVGRKCPRDQPRVRGTNRQ